MFAHFCLNGKKFLYPNIATSLYCKSSSGLSASLYDVLEISKNASHSQIKKAYYKLSLEYHPDVNKTFEAGKKFREITEAYEILGNFHKRKMYDSGLLSLNPSASSEEVEKYSAKFYEARLRKSHAPASGKSPIYDFDEWSRVHYTASFKRRQQTKAYYERMMMQGHKISGKRKAEGYIVIICFLIFGLLLESFTKNSVDIPKNYRDKKS